MVRLSWANSNISKMKPTLQWVLKEFPTNLENLDFWKSWHPANSIYCRLLGEPYSPHLVWDTKIVMRARDSWKNVSFASESASALLLSSMTFVELEQRAKCQTRQSIPLLSEKAYSQCLAWKKISTLAICDKRLVRIRNGYRVSTKVSNHFWMNEMSSTELAEKWVE